VAAPLTIRNQQAWWALQAVFGPPFLHGTPTGRPDTCLWRTTAPYAKLVLGLATFMGERMHFLRHLDWRD
jgi:hypothetical protein